MHTNGPRTGRSIGGRLAAFCAFCAFAVLVRAQQGPPQQPPPAFRTTTTLVEVDVIARDGKGAFVGDLGIGDFEVFEDGKPQEVSAIYRVVGPSEPGTAAAPATAVPAPPPQEVQRVLVFFFDQAHVEPGQFKRAQKAALDFAEKDFRPGDVGGVLTGDKMVNGRLTTSREELVTALKSINPAPEAATITRELRTWPRFSDIVEAWRITRNEPGYNPGPTMLADVTERACREQPDECSRPGGRAFVEELVQTKATQLTSAARALGRQTLNIITALANGLSRLPGRKTLVMLTGGFFVEDGWADLRQVVGVAARASVRIYAVDTRGLDRGSASSDIFTAGAPSQPELAALSVGDTNADGPNSLAVDTGGYVIRNENDFGRAFTEIDRDTSSYYILGFRTSRPPDGKFHGLDVKVKRAGVKVRARKGYVALATSPSPSPNPGPGSNPSPSSPNPSPSSPSPSSPSPSPGLAATASPLPPGAPAPKAEGPLHKLDPEAVEGIRVAPGAGGGAGERGPDPATEKAARAGWEAYQRGDVKAALQALRPLAGNSGARPWAHYVLGWSEYAAGNFGAAVSAWEHVRGRVAEFKPVYFDLADGYLQQKEFGKAIAVLRDAEKRWPSDAEVFNALGVLQAGRGALNDAITSFEKAVAANPQDATASYNLAKSLELRYVRVERERKTSASLGATVAAGDRDRAIEYYRRTVELGGANVEAAKEGLKRLSGGQQQ